MNPLRNCIKLWFVIQKLVEGNTSSPYAYLAHHAPKQHSIVLHMVPIVSWQQDDT